MSAYSNIVNVKMAALSISQQQLSFYSQIHTHKLSPFLSGQRDLGAVDLEKINDTLAGLEKLAEAFTPLPLDFRQVIAVKRLLEQLKYGELDEWIAATRGASAKLMQA